MASSFWGCGISDVSVATDFVHITSRRVGAKKSRHVREKTKNRGRVGGEAPLALWLDSLGV